MNENGDPSFGAVNNVQLLWKLQTLQSLGIPVDHNETMEQTQDFAPDLATADSSNSFVHDDLAQEVDKLLNMQQGIVPPPLRLPRIATFIHYYLE